MTNGNYWIREPKTEYFFNIVQAAVGRRFAKVLESEMLCRYVILTYNNDQLTLV